MYFSEGLAVLDEGFTAFSSCSGMTTYNHHNTSHQQEIYHLMQYYSRSHKLNMKKEMSKCYVIMQHVL
jgi:hypothetical protein